MGGRRGVRSTTNARCIGLARLHSRRRWRSRTQGSISELRRVGGASLATLPGCSKSLPMLDVGGTPAVIGGVGTSTVDTLGRGLELLHAVRTFVVHCTFDTAILQMTEVDSVPESLATSTLGDFVSTAVGFDPHRH